MPRFLGSYARQSVEASHCRAHILANVATRILNGLPSPQLNECLTNDLGFSVHAGQPLVKPLMKECQLAVVQSHEV